MPLAFVEGGESLSDGSYLTMSMDSHPRVMPRDSRSTHQAVSEGQSDSRESSHRVRRGNDSPAGVPTRRAAGRGDASLPRDESRGGVRRRVSGPRARPRGPANRVQNT
jgi:hypothetical protein